jgi:DNA (cytosine-5)-methyltransferase 3A
MNILSLFDGMSCGQIALNRANIKYDKYYASEIKKHAIFVTQYNYPNTIQLGDITKIKWNNLDKIDLLMFGSPCQNFSRGNKERTGLNGEKSSLFFEGIGY